MTVEPREGPGPGIGRFVGAIVGTLVAVEAVAGVFVADNVGIDAGIRQRGAQLFDVVDRDRRVLVAEEAEPRRFQCGDFADERGELREATGDDPAAVEAHRGAERAAQAGKERDAPTEAKADDADVRVVETRAAEMVERGVDVGQDRVVTAESGEVFDHLLEVPVIDDASVARAVKQIGRDGVIARIREATRDVFDMAIDAEGFLHDHDRARRFGGTGLEAAHRSGVRRQLQVSDRYVAHRSDATPERQVGTLAAMARFPGLLQRCRRPPAGVVLGVSFIAGAIPSSQIAARRPAHVDLRDVGSGTVSGTGLYEVAGFAPLAVAGIVDIAKATVGPLLATRNRPVLQAVAGGTAIAGHNLSPFLRGAGGRGFAPSLGALGVNAWPGVPVMLGGLVAGRLAGETALGGLVAQAALVPVLGARYGGRGALVGACVVAPMLVKRLAGNARPSQPTARVYVDRLLFDRDDRLMRG